MKDWFQKAYHGQMGVYLRFFVLLLSGAVLILIAMSISGCESCSCDGDFDPKKYVPYYQTNYGRKGIAQGCTPSLRWEQDVVGPGDTVNLTIVPCPDTGKRDITWTPPPGTMDFEFLGKQPEPGGPPWVFKDVDAYDDLQVSYNYLKFPWVINLADTVESKYADGSRSAVAREIAVVDYALTTAAPFTPATLHPASAQPQANVDAWAVDVWLAPRGITLTTQLCQEWATRLQGDEFFLAVRMPMTTTAITGSYRLPFVFGSPYSQTLHLRDYSSGSTSQVITATLEYRPERHTFLANELPQAAGEHWAALGIAATEPVSCPAGLNVPSGEWGLKANLLLDLHDQPDACEGCTVLVYGCYEGQNPPESLAARMLARTMGVQSYQGEGITCFGAKPLRLDESANGGLHIGGALAAAITPTLPITMMTHIDNRTGNPVTLTLAYTSTVDNWQFYGGAWDAPDTNQPIIPGVTELTNPGVGFLTHIWAVNNPVPADTEAGSHSLVLTVTSTTSPALTAWEAIPLWSGGWIAPPPPSESKYRVYLPLVTK